MKEESFAEVAEELKVLSQRLHELLPDPALSPQERVERLARVAPHTTLVSAYHRTARSKLNELRGRLAEIVPEPELSPLEKIDFLADLVNMLVPDPKAKFFIKLEKIGDDRGSDNGR